MEYRSVLPIKSSSGERVSRASRGQKHPHDDTIYGDFGSLKNSHSASAFKAMGHDMHVNFGSRWVYYFFSTYVKDASWAADFAREDKPYWKFEAEAAVLRG